ncbi:hypothetical protein ACJW31_01G172500 [Castanea mollissima]
MNQIFTYGWAFEKGPQKQVLYHFIMEARMCIMEHIMCNPYYMVVDERRLMNAKVCGFLVSVIEEFRVMEEGEECDVTTRSGEDEKKKKKAMKPYITIVCSRKFNFDSPEGNFMFFFFF